ncbi:MAG: lysostaphin resistance A-like protein [Gemmatimonadales bacterium]
MTAVAATTSIRRFARRRPLTLFFLFVFGLGYPLMLVPILAGWGADPVGALPGGMPLNTEVLASLGLVLLVLLPAPLVVTALEGGRPAVAALLRRVAQWRFGLGWWVLILVALPLGTVLLSLALGDSFGSPSLAVLGDELVGTVVAVLLIQIIEETAWAGFVQTRLERRYGFYLAALLTAIPFAAIHLPLQVIYQGFAPVGLATTFGMLIAFGFVFRAYLGLVMRGAANSVLAVAVAHSIFNRANNPDGIAADLLDGSHRTVAALIVNLVVVVVLGIAMRGRTGRAERERLDAASGERPPAAGGEAGA